MTDNRQQALASLALFAKGIIPTRINAHDYEPTRQDARDMVTDLLVLADKVDAVLLEYGIYLESQGIIAGQDVRDYFTNVLENALTGNALYAIESNIEKQIEERAA